MVDRSVKTIENKNLLYDNQIIIVLTSNQNALTVVDCHPLTRSMLHITLSHRSRLRR